MVMILRSESERPFCFLGPIYVQSLPCKKQQRIWADLGQLESVGARHERQLSRRFGMLDRNVPGPIVRLPLGVSGPASTTKCP